MADDYTAPAPTSTSYQFRADDDGTRLWPAGVVGWGTSGGPYALVDVASGQGFPVQPDAGAVFHVIVDSGSVTAAGGATAAKQDTEIASLASIDGKLPALVGGAVPVAVPVGVSTSAKQDTGNTLLASIDGKITAVNTGAVVVASGSITASIAAAQTIAVTNAGTFLVQAAQSGTWTVTGAGGTFPATQSGTWTVGISAAQTIAVTNAGTFAVQLSSALPAGTNVIGHVIVDSGTITTVSTVTAVTAITNALPAGSNVIGHVIVDSGTITTVSAVTAITNALPAGTNAIGKLAANSGVTIGAVELAAAQTLATVTTVGAVTSITNALPAGSAIIGKVTTDQTTHGTTDLVAADITKVAGATISQGHGTAATAIRVELPTDGTGVVGLIAGTALVGKVGIDQTTPGTTNAVAVIAGQNGVAGGAGAVGATVQRTTLASDDPAVATLGATSGAAVITDANGTIQQYLRGLVKLSVTAGGVNVTKSANNLTLADGSAISWQASGGTYALTCTSVTNNNGRQGVKGDLGATRAQRYAVQVTFSVGSAATNGLEIEVYWAASPSATAGTSNPGGTSGTDATFNTTPDEYKLQLQFIGSLVLSNNAGTGIQTTNLGPFTPRFRYGMPVIVNKSGQTLGATAGDHTVVLYPMQDAG